MMYSKIKVRLPIPHALLFMIFSLLTYCSLYAQSDVETPQFQDIKSIKVGTKLPESFWQQEHTIYANGKTIKKTLAEYRDKLLILDFWASWCGPCLRKFAFSDSLNRSFSGQLTVLLVNADNTGDTNEKIISTMLAKGNGLSTIIGDSILWKQFPHAIIPHYIWIENGQYRAAIGTELFNLHNVEAVLDRRRQLNEIVRKRNEAQHAN